MKNAIIKIYKLTLASCCLLLSFNLVGQIENSKNIEKTFEIKDGGTIDFEHKRGRLDVKQASDGQAKIEMNVSVKGKDEENVNTTLEQISLEANGNGSSLVSLKTLFNIQNWIQINKKSSIKFKNGIKVNGITDIKVTATLFVPKDILVKLKNKYYQINIESLENDLDVELYDADIYLSDLQGELNLELKYGNAKIGNIIAGDFELYECDLTCNNAKTIKLDSKYSDHEINTVEILEVKSYEGDYELNAINQSFDITDKYSKWEIGTASNGKFDLYESKFKIDQISNIEIKSKYSKFDFKNAGSLNFNASYEDELTADILVDLVTDGSKYGEFSIGELQGSLVIEEDYESDIKISQVSNSFQKIHIDGKYTDVDAPLNAGAVYHLDANINYGKVNYPKESFDVSTHIEKNSQLEIKGNTKGAGPESPQITVEGYEVKLDLQ